MIPVHLQLLALIVASIIPTVAVLGLFVRFGSLLQTVKRIEGDYSNTTAMLREVSSGMTELKAWREATAATHDDILSRVRRLEDRALGGSHG